ncbi:MAG: bifunctional diaminohydroxyphosphoribosylaminopyrimidine deaminase/5-amino-6-(5-phosphoribosylamino)uracil reductase RibD [Candidatus Kapaibacterium sp.]
MDRAVELAHRGQGHVAPNPLVGCVILHDGDIIAEGWHERFGGPHAEVNAIGALRSVPERAVLVCTLEPCSHTGKTPPCADAIIAAGIKHVVVGTVDPFHEVAGRGIERLRDAGVRVDVGVKEKECAWMNRMFLHAVVHEEPYVILKIAQSLDGCVATSRGESAWITNEHSRRSVHRLRSVVDAVCVGSGTVAHDDPSLTVRLCEGRNPVRIVIDTDLRAPVERSVYDSLSRSIVCCSPEASRAPASATLQKRGVTVVPVPLTDGHVDLREMMRIMYKEYAIQSVLVEAGPGLASAMINADIPQELHLYVAPVLLGDGLRAFDRVHTGLLNDARRFALHSADRLEDDLHITLTKKA